MLTDVLAAALTFAAVASLAFPLGGHVNMGTQMAVICEGLELIRAPTRVWASKAQASARHVRPCSSCIPRAG